jgi:hypothetical protein
MQDIGHACLPYYGRTQNSIEIVNKVRLMIRLPPSTAQPGRRPPSLPAATVDIPRRGTTRIPVWICLRSMYFVEGSERDRGTTYKPCSCGTDIEEASFSLTKPPIISHHVKGMQTYFDLSMPAREPPTELIPFLDPKPLFQFPFIYRGHRQTR